MVVEAVPACVLRACVSASAFRFGALPEAKSVLGSVFPVIPKRTADSPSRVSPFPSLPLSFTSGTDVNSSEVGGNHVFLLPPSLRRGADSLLPTPYSHKQRESSSQARNKLLFQSGDLQVTKRSAMASVLIRRTGNSQEHSPAPSLFGQLVLPGEGYISSTLMREAL